MNRTKIINQVIESIDAEKYLEVGVRRAADNYDQIKCRYKIGIDSKSVDTSPGLLRQDSDTFFSVTAEKFDVIFIDGDHRHAQCRRDVLGALRHLSSGGRIIMHDCLPTCPAECTPDKIGGGPWCGEVWVVYCKMLQRRDIIGYVVDCDHGVGVLRRGREHNPLSANPCQPWSERSDLRIITPQQFLSRGTT